MGASIPQLMDLQMNHQTIMTTAYDLPFGVRYSSGSLLASGSPVDVFAVVHSESDLKVLATVIDLFAGLSATGCLAGTEVEPWNSGLQIYPDYTYVRFQLINSRVDERALIVLAHLLLARQEDILLESLEVSLPGKRATQKLQYDPVEMSTYPDVYRKLPFPLIDEQPESGGYTFVAELREPLQAQHGEYLENALKRWTEAILAGGYGLAPIPPQESYVEPDDESVTSFDTTVEWTAFKLRADPASVYGLVNIFAAFHHRCQEIVSLTIT